MKNTDFENLTETFDKLKINFEVITYDFPQQLKNRCGDKEISYDKIIKIDNGFGYFDFLTEFYFLDEVFKCHAVFE